MSILTTISLIIIFIIVGLLLFIFMPKPQVFFDATQYNNLFDNLINQNNENNKLDLSGLTDEILQNTELPVVCILQDGKYLHNGKYPKLEALLNNIPLCKYAGIINLNPKFEQVAEYSYNLVSNDTLRCFYTIKQSGNNKSGIWIDGEKRFFSEKSCILGDMSREHYLFNKHKINKTTVLFLDLERPSNIKKGCSPNLDINKDEILKTFKIVDNISVKKSL
jgi:hypothetical protein